MAATVTRALFPVSPGCCALRSSLAAGSPSQVSLVAHGSHLVRNGGKLDSSSRRVVSITASAFNGRDEVGSKSEYVPGAEFYKVEAIVRPWRLALVTSSLIDAGIRGVTVADVRGFGSQGGSRERHAGSEFSEDSFVQKVKLEVVVSKDQVEVVVDTIIDQARTGEIGDGKIFILPVADVIRVRTGERGLEAERMAGGRSDLLSTRVTKVN